MQQPWLELADLLHLRPDDFPIPWFLDFVFGADPPEDSVVAAGIKLSEVCGTTFSSSSYRRTQRCGAHVSALVRLRARPTYRRTLRSW
jgi:hypothetical protein